MIESASDTIVVPKDEGELPTIVLSGRFLDEIAQDIWRVISENNAKTAMVLQREGKLCRVVRAEDNTKIVEFSADDIPFVVERLARCVTEMGG